MKTFAGNFGPIHSIKSVDGRDVVLFRRTALGVAVDIVGKYTSTISESDLREVFDALFPHERDEVPDGVHGLIKEMRDHAGLLRRTVSGSAVIEDLEGYADRLEQALGLVKLPTGVGSAVKAVVKDERGGKTYEFRKFSDGQWVGVTARFVSDEAFLQCFDVVEVL